MPFRKTKGWGQTKPQAGAMLDYGDPINAGCRGAWMLNEGGGLKAQNTARPGQNRGTFTGITQGATSGWAQGRFGPGVLFDGTDDYIDCGNIKFTNTAVSVCGWHRTNGNYTQSQAILSQSDATTAQNHFTFAFGLTDNKYTALSAGNIRITNNTSISTDAWRFVAFTRSADSGGSATWNIFLNGVADASSTLATTGADVTNTNQLCMSRYGAFNSYFLVGKLDNVRLWERELQPSEIMRLYQEPFAGIVPSRRRIISQVAGGAATIVGSYYYLEVAGMSGGM